MAEWQVERLGRDHARQAFSCGKPPLDEFIRRHVSQYEKRNLGRTYLAVRPGERQVLGYYTLASGSIPFLSMPEASAKKLPAHPVPAILLARLAVDRSAQGRGLGAHLLIDALDRSLMISGELGIHSVEVHAIDVQAGAFYQKYGFLPLLDNESHLFLPINSIRTAFPHA